jgi:hypothetical protein
MFNLLDRFIQKGILAAIDLYQKTISPDHGWGRLFFPNFGCRYYPTCSEYLKQSVLKHGLVAGFYSGIKRIGRCHPLSRGGYDPVR